MKLIEKMVWFHLLERFVIVLMVPSHRLLILHISVSNIPYVPLRSLLIFCKLYLTPVLFTYTSYLWAGIAQSV